MQTTYRDSYDLWALDVGRSLTGPLRLQNIQKLSVISMMSEHILT